ncbi:uncharacterized protein CEXT_18021 [Caerostris extrusa]|uniref:Uncharacterized protein n=1 Tax=Caerostris extrusa TaxID=172846 RepID=A0AAV4QE55_CAEEX|nr:uncharacterized protein CEXT_18021 [Caerostris extrusa]
MKFSRQGKLIFSTADPVCVAQILNLDKILETPISTAVTFENISERFLVFDIPTTLPLSELAAEIMHKNDMEVVESEKCIHCTGPHSATSKICPRHIHEQKILEFKCRNHLTIGEARRIYAQSSKTNYSDAAKTNTTAPNIEEIVNQRVESIVQNIAIKMEQQTTLLIEIFQKQSKILCNIWSQYSIKRTSKNP